MVRIRAWGGMRCRAQLAVLAAAALIGRAAGGARAAKSGEYTYRCIGNDGKKYYGSTIPARLPRPAARADQQAGPGGEAHRPRGRREGEQSPRKPRRRRSASCDAATKDAQRRNRALLATYTSEKDIEERARPRPAQPRQGRAGSRAAHRGHQEAPGAVPEGARAVQDRRQGRAAHAPERGNHQRRDRPQGAETLLDAKKKEAVGINARYDEDKRRYKEATGRK